MAAIMEGCHIIGIDKEVEYLELQRARISAVLAHREDGR